ncbi:Histamine H4 receptor [Microtus ochrogaster]|uniref:Histamine H4 receptor n=1 Tax=Microtus ochrogaster TaxID=79684 RepID=A0A8J6GUX9_MICOH|nr:Histamine H4 receptor [Microtus ochrogaster]
MTLKANSSGSLTLTAKVSLALLMSLLAFAIMLGNAVVILAFVVDKNLRHRSNYFLLNLAISDFFVGAISIPLYIPHTVFTWNFGSEICTFWLIVDYLLCTASVYNIVLISYDRYQSVSNASRKCVHSVKKHQTQSSACPGNRNQIQQTRGPASSTSEFIVHETTPNVGWYPNGCWLQELQQHHFIFHFSDIACSHTQ